MKKYSIDEITPLKDSVKLFRIVPDDKKNMGFKPGQFVKLCDVEERVYRPYSIASSPDEEYLEFAVKMVGGQFTSYLDGLRVGDALLVDGPFGDFTFEGQEKCVFIAGGTGIAPLMSIIRYIEEKNVKGDFTLFFSCKHTKDILFRDELEKLENVKAVFTLTREEPEDWKGEKGRVCEEMINKYVKDVEKQHWYVCGPLAMCLNLRKRIVGMGGKDEKIKIEGWG